MKTLIIIPTYNEEENIKDLITQVIKSSSSFDHSILVVDDNSTDSTRTIVKELRIKYSNLYLLERDGKYGLASAYIDGFKWGLDNNYDAFVQMDADFSHNPKYLQTIFENLKQSDVVIASRNIKGGNVVGWSFLRNLISKGGSLYSRLVLSCPIMDLTGGYNAWTREVLLNIGLDNIISKGYCFQIEMKYRAFKKGYKIKEFPIVFIDRRYGQSKMSKEIFFEALINILKIKAKI